jgi:hypothetical protein
MALSKYSDASNHRESRRLSRPRRINSEASDAISEERKAESGEDAEGGGRSFFPAWRPVPAQPARTAKQVSAGQAVLQKKTENREYPPGPAPRPSLFEIQILRVVVPHVGLFELGIVEIDFFVFVISAVVVVDIFIFALERFQIIEVVMFGPTAEMPYRLLFGFHAALLPERDADFFANISWRCRMSRRIVAILWRLEAIRGLGSTFSQIPVKSRFTVCSRT